MKNNIKQIKHKKPKTKLQKTQKVLFVFGLLSPGKTLLFCMFVVGVLLSWLKEKWLDSPEMEGQSVSSLCL